MNDYKSAAFISIRLDYNSAFFMYLIFDILCSLGTVKIKLLLMQGLFNPD